MHTLQSFNKVIFIIISLIYCFSTNAQSAASCNALVKINNDFWLATQNGELQKQLTHDGKLKFTVAVSPNGKVIGYSGEQSGHGVTLIDTNGIHLADVIVNVEDAITSLVWTSHDTLKIGQHISPRASKYFFMRVPTNPFSNHFSEILPPVAGEDCTSSPDGKYVACFLGGTLSLNDHEVYSFTDPFLAAEKVQSLNLAVGSMAETSTTPVFQIQILEIKDGQIHIKVSSTPGEWQEYYQKSGDTAELTYYIDSNDFSRPLPLFGLQSNFSNPNAKTSLLTVVKNLEGGVSFELGPIWDTRGKRIAFIEKNDAGKRVLVLVRGQMCSGGTANCAVDGRIRLPVQTSVTAIKFTSETHIVIQVENGKKLDIDIPAQGKIPSTTSIQVNPSLPNQIAIKNNHVLVEDWICAGKQ